MTAGRWPAFEGAIFDLDGTLLDSMHVWDAVDRIFLERRGLAVPEDYGRSIAHLGFRETAEYTIHRFSLPDSPEAVMDEWLSLCREAYATNVPLKPGAGEYLRRLKACGVRLVVATASREELFVPALQRTGVYALFDAFVTVEEVARGKGFPDIYWRAAEKLGLPPGHCIVFEDILEGVRGAKAGGFFTVGVADEASAPEQETIRMTADDWIADYFAEPCIAAGSTPQNVRT